MEDFRSRTFGVCCSGLIPGRSALDGLLFGIFGRTRIVRIHRLFDRSGLLDGLRLFYGDVLSHNDWAHLVLLWTVNRRI
jgi:hypothetical protein